MSTRIRSYARSLMELMSQEDLVDIPRVEFIDIGTMEYSIKAKKIIDLRESYD